MAKAKVVKEEVIVGATDLVVAENLNPAILFSDENNTLEDLLQAIEKEVSTIVPDVSTAKGRKAITVNVSRVTKSKTTLETLGKNHVAAEKERLKKFDAQRKHAFTFLEELQKEVRKPLTEWEDKEKARVAKYEGVISSLINAGEASENWMNSTVEELNELMAKVEEVTITKRFQEFEEEAEIAKKDAIKKINASIESREKYDAEQKELEKLRADAAEADRLRFEADQRAEQDRAIREAEIKANDEKEAAIKAAEKEKEEAQQRAVEAEENAKREAEEAEKQKQIEVEQAAQSERDRIEQERLKEEQEAAAREADTKHRGKINRAAMKAIIDSSKAYDSGENVITEGQAKLIIKIIANGKIPNIKINY